MEKDFISNAKVLLISDMVEDYKILQSLGFQNINFMRSLKEADSYFYDRKEELDSYFIIILGFLSNYSLKVLKNSYIEESIKELTNRKYFYEEPNNRMPYPWYLELYIKVPEEQIKEEWNINNKTLFNIIKDCLKHLGYEQINVLPTKKTIENKIVIKEQVINFEDIIKHLRDMALTYLNIKNNGFSIKCNNLNIYEVDNNIRIEYIIEGRIVSTVIFNKDYMDILDFIEIETLNNKGKLIRSEVGVNSLSSFRSINEKELNIIKTIDDKISTYINNLNKRKPYVLKNRLW